MRIVMDTDTIVAAMRSPKGASAELLRRVRRGTRHIYRHSLGIRDGGGSSDLGLVSRREA